MNKKCTSCDLSLSYDSYYKNKTAKDGFRSACKKCCCKDKSNFYVKNQVRIVNSKKEYRRNNKEKVSATSKKYISTRLQNDCLFRLTYNIRSLIYHSLKNSGTKKNSKTIQMLQCSFSDFKDYLENQFDKAMNWDNHGSYWSIDHICPCGQAQNEEELIKLQHYSNLRPMISHGPNGNFAKSDSKTQEAQNLCFKLLNRNWID